MQHINDDIDDLLRNAAENYPLKIKRADWESVAGRLSSVNDAGKAAPAIVVPIVDTFKRYRKYLFVMLLIPFGIILAKYSGLTGGNNAKMPVQQQKTAKVESKAATMQAVHNAQRGVNNEDVVKPVQVGELPITYTKSDKGVSNSTAFVKIPLVKSKVGQFSMQLSGASAEELLGNSSTADDKKQSNVSHLSDLPILEQQQAIKENNAVNGENAVLQNGFSIPNESNTAEATENINGIGNNNEAVASQPKLNTAASQTATTTLAGFKAVDPLVHHNIRKGRFYIGAFVAPDYTTVKYQPGSKVGFNFGGVVGYTFVKNLSVEVGMAAGRKYYTSNGKYFNSTESWLSNWGKILTISGYASLTEFPVNFKYDFKPGRDGNFFVTAGVLSYIVHQENYNYLLDKNGVIYTRDKSPIVATTNALANFSLSGGYESSLGGLCNFRIEPYYRIPIKGIGIGGLPITSIGLNIGITKKFK